MIRLRRQQETALLSNAGIRAIYSGFKPKRFMLVVFYSRMKRAVTESFPKCYGRCLQLTFSRPYSVNDFFENNKRNSFKKEKKVNEKKRNEKKRNEKKRNEKKRSEKNNSSKEIQYTFEPASIIAERNRPTDHYITVKKQIPLEQLGTLSKEEEDTINEFNQSSRAYSGSRLKVLTILVANERRRGDLMIPNYDNEPMAHLNYEDLIWPLKHYLYRLDSSSKAVQYVKEFIKNMIKTWYDPDYQFVFLRTIYTIPFKDHRQHYALTFWAYFCLTKYGTAELLNYRMFPELQLLADLTKNLSKLSKDSLLNVFENIKVLLEIPNTKIQEANKEDTTSAPTIDSNTNDYDRQLYNSLLSSMIYVALRKRHLTLVESLWLLKDPSYRTSNDLHYYIMALNKQKRFGEVASVVERHPLLRDLGQFTQLLRAYGSSKDWVNLRKLFENFYSYKQLPNIDQYGIMMNALAEIRQYRQAKLLYQQILSRKMVPSYFIYLTMLKACIKVNKHSAILRWFHKFKMASEPFSQKNPPRLQASKRVAYTLLFQGLAKMNDSQKAFDLLRQMAQNDQSSFSFGVKPTLKMYTSALQSCAGEGNISLARQIFQQAKNDSHITQFDQLFFSAYMAVYRSCSDYKAVYRVFDTAVQQYKVVPDTSMYCEYFASALNHSNYEAVELIIQKVRQNEIKMNSVMYALLIQYYVKINSIRTARLIIEQMTRSSIKPSAIHYNALMRGYSKNKDYESVKLLFDKMLSDKVRVTHRSSLLLANAVIRQEEKKKDFSYDQVFNLLNGYFELTAEASKEGKHVPMLMLLMFRIVEFFRRKVNVEQASDILKEYMSYTQLGQSSFVYRVGLIKSMIVIKSQAQQWKTVEILFDTLLRLFLEQKSVEWIHARTSSEPDAKTHIFPRHYNQIIQPRFKHMLADIIKYKFQEMLEHGSAKHIPRLLTMLIAKGFQIPNQVINKAIKMSCEHVEAFPTMMVFVDRFMVDNYFYKRYIRLQKRKGIFLLRKPSDFQPHIHLNIDTIISVKSALQTNVQRSLAQKKTSVQDSKTIANLAQSYKQKYPKIMKLLSTMKKVPVRVNKQKSFYKQNRRFQ